MAPINVRFETGDRFEFNWNPHGEILLAPFAIAPGVVIRQARTSSPVTVSKHKPAVTVRSSLEIPLGSALSLTAT